MMHTCDGLCDAVPDIPEPGIACCACLALFRCLDAHLQLLLVGLSIEGISPLEAVLPFFILSLSFKLCFVLRIPGRSELLRLLLQVL